MTKYELFFYKKVLNIISILIVSIFLNSRIWSDPFILNESMNGLDLTSNILLLTDSTSKLSIEEIQKISSNFKPLENGKTMLGIHSGSWWLKFNPTNSSKEEISWILQVVYPQFDFVDVYYFSDVKLKTEYHIGDNNPFSNRPLPHETNLIPLKTIPNEHAEIYIKLSYRNPAVANILTKAWTSKEFLDYNNKQIFIYGGLTLGIFLILIINLFFYLSTRMVAYAWYVIYLFAVILSGLSQKGLGHYFFWYDSIWVTDFAPVFIPALTYILAIQFTRVFLQTKDMTPKIDLFFKIIMTLYLFVFVLLLVGLKGYAVKFVLYITVSTSIMYPVLGLYIWNKGKREARFYTVAWGFWSIGMIIGFSRLSGLVNINMITEVSPILGVVLEALFLSFALADRINILRYEKEETEQKYMMSLEKSKEELEMNVQERTLQLQKKTIQLTELNATKDKFFSIIAHDLKNPIIGFKTVTQFLHEEYNDFDEAKRIEFLNMLKISAENVHSLLENLLEWSRSQRGVIDFNPMSIDLNSIVQKNNQLMQISTENKSISLHNLIQGGIQVYADPNLLITIIRNLVSNAIKFTPKGGLVEIGYLEDKLQDNNQPEKYIIYVKDTGIGMDTDTVDKLFRIDQNISRPGTDGESSTGLGLLLCKEFTEMHGGKIWAESVIGKGSTFYFSLLKFEESTFFS